MVLSCCDLLVVLTNHPYTAFVTILWLTEKIYKYPAQLLFPYRVLNIFTGFSLLALLVMNVDRYLATHYPIFHRTSVTKGKLLTLFTLAVIFEITLGAMSINDLVISYQVGLLVFFVIYVPPCCLSTTKCLQSPAKVVEITKYHLKWKNLFLSRMYQVACW